MNSAEILLAGSDITLPQLEAIELEAMPVYEQVLCLAAILKNCHSDDILPALKKRQAGLNSLAAHSLNLADAQKPIMNKISIAHGGTAPYKVWLHAYSETEQSADHKPVYVERFHNHRHGLASLILRGGYTADEYRLKDPKNHQPWAGDFSLEEWSDLQNSLMLQTAIYRPGDVMYIHPDETHRLRGILPGTKTFVLETPVIRNYSVGFTNKAAHIIIPDMVRVREQSFEFE
ncbi:MAG TPA: hypothetical protein VF733_05355 [Candidatus Saccharimonadales bacterium]